MKNIPTFTLNEIGLRDNLEDAISRASKTGKQVYVVCDGVGGSNSGEVASELAVKHFYKALSASYEKINSLEDFKEDCQLALSSFKQELQDFQSQSPKSSNASTTLTVAVVVKNSVFIAWCGDSTVFQIRNGEVVFKTKDHSLVQQLVDNQEIRPEDAKHHPNKNIILRSLNQQTKITDIDFTEIELTDRDWLLLCSDGLTEQFDVPQFKTTLNGYNPNTNYREIIRRICEGSTRDNYSMILLNHIEEKSNKKLLMIGFLIGAIALSLIYFLKPDGKVTPQNTPPEVRSNKSGFKTFKKDSTVSTSKQDSINLKN